MLKIFSKKITLFLLLFASVKGLSQDKKWTLQECIEYALIHNVTVKQSELDLKLKETEKSDALGAFIPSANINSGHFWSIGLNPDPITGINRQQTTQYTTAGFGSQVDLYKGLQNQARFRKSKMAILAAQYQLQKIKDDITLNITNAYLQILFNRETLKQLQEQLEDDSRQHNRSKELFENGLLSNTDLLEIEGTVSLDKQNIIEAEGQLMISKLSLAQLLQLDDYKNFDISEENEKENREILLETPESIFEKAKETYAAMQLAKANLKVAEQDVKIARGAYQPSLTAFYNLDTRVSYSDYIDYIVPEGQEQATAVFRSQPPFWTQFWENKGHTFGLQLSIPILNGFRTRNNVSKARIAFDRLQLDYGKEELELERNIYTAFKDAQRALKAFDTAGETTRVRNQALQYAQEHYQKGLISVYELNQIKTLSINAMSEQIRLKYDFIFKLKILEFYSGQPLY